MREIVCNSPTHGNQIALVDDSDFDKVNQYTWNVTCNKREDGTNKYYARCSKLKKSMHKFIFGDITKGNVIDHINGNSLDNTRENLREATQRQNMQNVKSKNTYKGVSWDENSKKYYCQALGEYIGLFDDEKSAAIEYDKYIIRELGNKGSRLNFEYTQQESEIIKGEIIDKNEERELPMYIFKSSNNKGYEVSFQKKYYKFYEYCKSLDEAIKIKNDCLEEIQEIEEKQLENHYSKSITYNKNGIAYIKVTCKGEDYECLVDEDKWHDLSLYTWSFDGNYVYKRKNKDSNSKVRLHRYLYEQYKSTENITDKKIDHIDGKDEISKRLDNRMSNLRPSTDGENTYNRETTNKLGYRGVTYRKNRNTYKAVLYHNNIMYYSKSFKTVEEAALAYNELAKQYYKDRAKLNTIKN